MGPAAPSPEQGGGRGAPLAGGAPLAPELEGLFCDVCGRDANDVVDEDFWLPTEEALARGYLSGRCQRHPPEEPAHFRKVHVGGGEGLGEA